MLKKVFKWNQKAMIVEGHIDFVSGNSMSGWFMDSNNGQLLTLNLYKVDAKNKTHLAAVEVKGFRADLKEIGKINPNSGFTLQMNEDLDFSNIYSYEIYINGKLSGYATNQMRRVVSQLVRSRVSPDVNIDQLIADRDWLIKMRGEESQELVYLKECESLLAKLLNEDAVQELTYEKEYLDLKDNKEFSDLLTLDMPYDDKKSGFSHIAMNILQRDLGNDRVDLKFERPLNPTVSIILVLYNKAELTYQCLKSIIKETSLDYELIIIDNNSTDQTNDLMTKVEGVTYIKNEDNVGFLKACNQARQYVTGEYILLLNNDAVIKNGSLKAGIDAFSVSDDIGVVGGKILHLDGMMQEAGSIIWSDASCLGYGRREHPDYFKYTYKHEVDYVSGALFFTPVKLWDEMGGFDERLAPCYYEETDFCIRAAKRGLKIIMEPKCQVTHFEFGSSSYSDYAVKQMQKNKLVIEDIHKDFLLTKYEAKPENIELAANTSKRKTVLYMDDQIPFDMLGAGFPRAKDVIAEINKSADVIVYPFCDNSDWGDMSLYEGIMLLPFAEQEALEYIKSVLAKIDAVWVSRPHNMEKLISRGWLSLFKENNIPVIYDAEALFSEREKLRCDLKGLEYDAEVEKNEFKLIDSADVVITVSDAEKKKITASVSKDAYVIGHPCLSHKVKKELSSNEILFVGNLVGSSLDSPNVDSIDYFLENYHGFLVKNNLQLVLVGKIDDDNASRWKLDNVIVKGCVDSLEESFENALCTIAPTRFAAGIPHKIHESLSWSTPVLASELILQQCGFDVDESGGLLTVRNLLKISSDLVFRTGLLSKQLCLAKDDMDINSFRCVVERIIKDVQ